LKGIAAPVAYLVQIQTGAPKDAGAGASIAFLLKSTGVWSKLLPGIAEDFS